MDFKYPYTDFHELNLDWFLARFKELVEEWNTLSADNAEFKRQMEESFATLDNTVQTFTSFVTNYFDNLDVQQEINNKLDALVADGTMSELLQPIFDDYAATITQRVNDQQGQINTLSSRVDNLATLTEGSTTGDAELADGRVSFNGITYSNIGGNIRNSDDVLNDMLKLKSNYIVNLFDKTDPDLELYKSISNSGNITNNANFAVTGYIPVKPYHSYSTSSWYAGMATTYCNLYDLSKNRIQTVNPSSTGYIIIPSGCAYIRVVVTLNILLYFMVIECNTAPNSPDDREGGIPYGFNSLLVNNTAIDRNLNMITDYMRMMPDDWSTPGILKNDGTIGSMSNYKIRKYTNLNPGEIYFINGEGHYYTDQDYAYLWTVKNDTMVNFIPATTNPQTFSYRKIIVDETFDEIWMAATRLDTTAPSLFKLTAVDNELRKNYANQWNRKSWYCYGTSISDIDHEGKYPNYLADMSGMALTCKGISGGGIGDLGAYSHGQVYDAICNTTDGKLDADIITLETGANDVNASVPLGTIYDTGRDTLAGCLNDCIRYLQANTTAQIVVFPSPVSTTYAPFAAGQVYEWRKMIKEICYINMVHFVEPDNNMGYAKLTGPDGSDYIVDNIHQTDLGGYVMAENIWYQLRNIPIFRTSMP